MSPMLHLTTSNAYEILKARLLSRLVQGTHDPFSPQEIIIPSIAIKRDIQLSVAQTCGIAAGMEFTFLAQWLWRCIAQL
ncbi:MAG: exodeoxyribonuclease V subunit gamma, partial [Azovibrio sp.]